MCKTKQIQYDELSKRLSIITGMQFHKKIEILLLIDANKFKQLIIEDNRSIKDINELMTWYDLNQGTKYVPVINDAEDFRTKYHMLIRARNRRKVDNEEYVIDPLGSAATYLSLHISSQDDIEGWKNKYKNLVQKWVDADIWPRNYKPDENKITQALIQLQEWSNNANWVDRSGIWCNIGKMVGELDKLSISFINWFYDEMEDTKEGRPGFLCEGIKEGALFPSSKLFRLFIEQLSRDISMYPGQIVIKSRGWTTWYDRKKYTYDERVAQNKTKQELQKQQIIKKKEVQKKIKNDVAWIIKQIEKSWSLWKTNNNKDLFYDFYNLYWKWSGKYPLTWKKELVKYIESIENNHIDNLNNKAKSYIYLLENPDKISK